MLGAAFLVQAVLMWRRSIGTEELSRIRPMELFHSSNLYLSLLFVSVALDPLDHPLTPVRPVPGQR